MTNQRRFGRRALLQGSAAGLALAPFLPLLDADAEAQGGMPVRVCFFWHWLGFVPQNLQSGDFDTNFARDIFDPLAAHKDDVLLLRGLDYKSAIGNGPNDHPPPMGALMTSRRTENNGGGAPTQGPGWDPAPAGPSIDQAIGAELATQTRFPTIQMGVGLNNYAWKLLFDQAGDPVRPEEDPQVARELLFQDAGLDEAQAEARRVRRLSVIDFVKDELAAIEHKVSADDKHKIERHLDHIRAQELLEQNPIVSCEADDQYADALRAEGGSEGQLSATGRRHMDTIVRAFACDLTRVATLHWHMRGWSADWFPPGEDPHAMSHVNNRYQDWADAYAKLGQFFTLHFAYMLQELAKIPEGDGTMLDNTVVVLLSEHALTGGHSRRDVPVLLGGRGGGSVRTGRQMNFDEGRMADLYLSLAQATGVNMTTFGDPQFVDQPLDLS
ncbi:MAG: DUF1552 domain-containing protein [Myxococcota bacterium]